MRTAHILTFACVGFMMIASSAAAKEKPGKENDLQRYSSTQMARLGYSDSMVHVQWAFSDEEKQVFQNYVQSRGETPGKRAKRLPPGLAKKVARGGSLPPGWQKKCAVGEIMPAQVYEQCHGLPAEVVVKLPAPPEPTLTVTVGGKIVRVLKATREILDVFNVNVRI